MKRKGFFLAQRV